jgi:hypothetical protein
MIDPSSTSVNPPIQTEQGPPAFGDRVRQAVAHFRALLGPPSEQTGQPIGCVEIRAFNADLKNGLVVKTRYKSTVAGWFNNADAFLAALRQAKGVSVFVTVNPVNEALLGRINSRLDIAKNTTTDADIMCLRWFYADVDPKRPPDISATEEERTAAIERRDKILIDHADLAACSIWGCSGNGGFILVRLPDYPNDEEHRELVARALHCLARRYSDDQVLIDTATANPSRIMCAVGTVKCKGDATESRPHRVVTLDSPERQIEPLDLVDWLRRNPPPPEPERQKKPTQGNTAGRDDTGKSTWVGISTADDYAAKVDWSEILEAHDWKLDRELPDGERRWTRSGKNAGTSASTGHKGRDVLHNFSGNAAPFQGGRTYTKFRSFAVLNHNGDMSAAAKQLYQQGFGTRQTGDTATLYWPVDDEADTSGEPSSNGQAEGGSGQAEAGDNEQTPDLIRPNELPDDPSRLARLFIHERHNHKDGVTLRFWQGEFLEWDGAYRPVLPGDVRARLHREIKKEFDRLNIAAIARWQRKKTAEGNNENASGEDEKSNEQESKC